MGMKFIDWDEFHYLLLALLFNCLAIKNLVTVFTLGTNLTFSSKTACLKGRSYKFKRVGRSRPSSECSYYHSSDSNIRGVKRRVCLLIFCTNRYMFLVLPFCCWHNVDGPALNHHDQYISPRSNKASQLFTCAVSISVS